MTEQETQVTTEETLPEVEEQQAPENDYQKRLEELEQAREAAETKAKDLSARLTREQQEKAELYRYHRETLPKINKSFADLWEESPEGAVKARVEEKVAPLSKSVEMLQAKTFLNNVLIKKPEWTKYESRAIELGDDFPQLTYSQAGVEKLFRLAYLENVETDHKDQLETAKVEAKKTRAYTEGSSPREAGKQKPRLTPAQRKVAVELGLTEEEYAKEMEN